MFPRRLRRAMMKRMRATAKEALALLSYPECGLPLPTPKHRGDGSIPVFVGPEDAAVLDAWPRHQQERACAAARQGREGSPSDIGSDAPDETSGLEAALRALGRRLVIGVEAA
jgi:antitoxin HicB